MALAGDDYPPLDCHGTSVARRERRRASPASDPRCPEATRTRDELQARLDLANLAAADAAREHPHQLADQGGQRIEIAFSPSVDTDETLWVLKRDLLRLAEGIQAGVVDHLARSATYERGDRGVSAQTTW